MTATCGYGTALAPRSRAAQTTASTWLFKAPSADISVMAAGGSAGRKSAAASVDITPAIVLTNARWALTEADEPAVEVWGFYA